MVGKFDAAALFLATTLCAETTSKHAPTHQREHLELALEFVVEELALATLGARRTIATE
jgi:hypothetical protein